MKLMLDTNIIVDVLSRRTGYEDSLQLIKHCEIGMVTCFISAVTVTDVMYILRKHVDPGLVRETVQTLLLIVDVAHVLKSDIATAFASEVGDYEDAVQVSCASRMNADYIITKNIKDFKQSIIPAITPSHVLELISQL